MGIYLVVQIFREEKVNSRGMFLKMIFVMCGEKKFEFYRNPNEQELYNVKIVSIGNIAKVIVFILLILKLIHHNFAIKSFFQKESLERINKMQVRDIILELNKKNGAMQYITIKPANFVAEKTAMDYATGYR